MKLVAEKTRLADIFALVAIAEDQGWDFRLAEASLHLLIIRDQAPRSLPFEVVEHHVSDRRSRCGPSVCEAIIKVCVNGVVIHRVADGDGPIHALDVALREALSQFYPELADVALTDYSVKLLNGSAGSSAKTSVVVEWKNGGRKWRTMGIDKDIIAASLQAMADSFEYYLLHIRAGDKEVK